MTRQLSPAELDRLPCCAVVRDIRGASHPLIADCAADFYKLRPLEELCTALGLVVKEPLTIVCGNGTLHLRPDSNEWVPLPRARDQAFTVARSAMRAGVAILAGDSPFVRADVLESRLATCVACEDWRPVDRRCGRCGCHAGKLRLAGESCPLGKWSSIATQ